MRSPHRSGQKLLLTLPVEVFKQSKRSGEAVEEVAAPYRAELAGCKKPGQRRFMQEVSHHLGIVVGLGEEARATSVAGEEQGTVRLAVIEELAEVLVG
jgi:hypothetical protein